MAREKNRAKWIIVCLTAMAMFAAVITTFVWAQADIKAVDTKAEGIKKGMGHAAAGAKERLASLKAEGCLPARENDKSIVAIEGELKSINGRLDDINKEQTAGFEAVMKKLNEK